MRYLLLPAITLAALAATVHPLVTAALDAIRMAGLS